VAHQHVTARGLRGGVGDSASGDVNSSGGSEGAGATDAYGAGVNAGAGAGAGADAGHTLTGILFGDVFVCSGQSNMVETVQLVNNATAEIAAVAAYPWIRLAVVGTASAATPLRDTGAPLLLPWQPPSPAIFVNASWSYFSAVCWFTARELANALGPAVPLGLVDAAVGGTPIERWTPGSSAGSLYNAMVAPLTGLAVKAILWYQGENNSFKPTKWITYAQQFPNMISLWREAWSKWDDGSELAPGSAVGGGGGGGGGSSDSTAPIPFGFVQIGPRDCLPCADHQGPNGTSYGSIRWAQTAFQYHVPNPAMPSTFMAVAADLAEGYSPVLPLAAGCVHYGNKQDVGKRLALGVRKAVYGHLVIDTGPMLLSASTSSTGAGASLVLTFATGESEGIVVRNTSGFELSANGRDYFGATIASHTSNSVTLAPPTEWRPRGRTAAFAAVSLRYILHDTPCVNKTCAVYGRASGLPSPPLIANLPGHAGADPVGWNMTAPV
jgi:sialate O-acetylesterase